METAANGIKTFLAKGIQSLQKMTSSVPGVIRRSVYSNSESTC